MKRKQVHFGWYMLWPTLAVVAALAIVSLPRMDVVAPVKVQTLDCGASGYCFEKPKRVSGPVCVNCFSPDMAEPFRGYRVLP